jgi:hypothetical protein
MGNAGRLVVLSHNWTPSGAELDCRVPCDQNRALRSREGMDDPGPSLDGFAAFDRLLALVTDPAACTARLAELRAATERLAVAETKLAAERQRCEQSRIDAEQARAKLNPELQRKLADAVARKRSNF